MNTEFDLWFVGIGLDYVVTEPMNEHPQGFKHEVRVTAKSKIDAVKSYIQYCANGDTE